MKFNTTRATPALVVANAMMVMAMMAIAYGPVGAQELQREFIDPAGVFTQVVTVADRGVKTIYVSGQVGKDRRFNRPSEARSAVGRVVGWDTERGRGVGPIAVVEGGGEASH